MAGAGWYPDPLGRAQVRYFDGSEWSPWAADNGQSRLDADAVLTGVPAPPDAPPPGMPPPPGTGWAPAARSAQQYRSVKGLSTAIMWVLIGSILSAIGLAATLANRLDVIQKLRDFEFVTTADIRDANDAVSGAAGLLGVLNLAVLVLFIIFLFRAIKNTELWHQQKERWSSGWAIGSWFIPFANFVIPFLVVRETWQRSDPALVNRPGARSSMVVLWFWWVLFVVGYLLIQVDPWTDTLDGKEARDAAGLAGALVLSVSAVLMIIVVRRLAKWQQQDATGGV